MKRTKTQIEKDAFPSIFWPVLSGADIYDSSCSREARVYFIDRDSGYFLKASPKGTLAREAELDAYFHSKGLGARVLDYVSSDKDYLLTERVSGEDLCDPLYMSDPKRTCDVMGEKLRELHSLDLSDCPIKNRTAEYLYTVEKNFKNGVFDDSFLPLQMKGITAPEAYGIVLENKHKLRADTLIHGDFCLPNIMFDNWDFSGFIDLGNAGVADRHIDLFWGAWTLAYNFGTDIYRDRFFDAYGRDRVDEDMISLVALCECFG